MADRALEAVRRHAVPLPHLGDVRAVLDAIPPAASIVLIGEASHGTHEFYAIRAKVTQALIESRGFGIVAVEADWPDAYRVNRWVRLHGDDREAATALDDFTRFPRWMWRNADVVRFASWLRTHNEHATDAGRAGFYGLDLYSLHRSMAHVIAYLDRVDPQAAVRARRGYACFDAFGDEVETYAYAASLDLDHSCEHEVVQELVRLRARAADYASRDGRIAADEYFVAEQNAQVVRDAEAYYRAMFRGGAASWNLRDQHMMHTLQSLLDRERQEGRPARIIVWAHNSHLGDARATAMAQRGELNVGQLVRERHGETCCSVGMTTHDGEVTAAHEWDDPAGRRRVRPSLEGSYERLFHESEVGDFVLDLSKQELSSALARPRLERAIGVIYRPETERASHYFSAHLPAQFDVVIHVDRTSAVEPLEPWGYHEADLPETFPSGI